MSLYFCVSAAIIALSAILLAFITYAAYVITVSSHHHEKGCNKQRDEVEGFDEGEYTVLKVSPNVVLRILFPPEEHVPKRTFSSLIRYHDAGIMLTGTPFTATEKQEKHEEKEIPSSDPRRIDELYVTDTLRFFRRRIPSEVVLSALVDSDKHFCVVGNMLAVRPGSGSESENSEDNDGDEDEDGEQDEYFLVSFLSRQLNMRRKKKRAASILCLDFEDVWFLKCLLFALSVPDPHGVVDKLDVQIAGSHDRLSEALLSTDDTKQGGTVIMTTIAETHPFWNKLKETDTVFFGYDSVDVNKLRHTLPFCVLNNIDVRDKLLPQVKGERNVYRTASVHAILAGHRSAELSPLLSLASTAIIEANKDRRIDVASLNSFLTMHFPFYDATMNVLRDINQEIYQKRSSSSPLDVGRPKFQILEQFSEQDQEQEPLTITLDRDELKGFMLTTHQGRVKRLRVTAYSPADRHSSDLLRVLSEEGNVVTDRILLRGIPVRQWDRVVLKAQRRLTENGAYFVTCVRPHKGYIILADVLVVAYDDDNDLAESKGGDDDPMLKVFFSVERHPRVKHLRKRDKVFVPNVGSSGMSGTVRCTSLRKEKRMFVSVLLDTQSGDDGKSDEKYTCYEDPVIQVKEACEEMGHTWDRPCRTNAECPYFQANMNYRNYRGGCVDGHCEMPLGVERAGFRKVDSRRTMAPICHGCLDPFDPNCCSEQEKERDAYPQLKSADLAFELDGFERYALLGPDPPGAEP